MQTTYGILHLINELAVLQKNAKLSDSGTELLNDFAAASNPKLISMVDEDGKQLPNAHE